MNITKLGSGDNNKITQSTNIKETIPAEIVIDESDVLNEVVNETKDVEKRDEITPETIDENEIKLKERIAQCKNLITTLKLELNEEKTKLEKKAKEIKVQSNDPINVLTLNNANTSDKCSDLLYSANTYSACVNSKLNCDENLMEYEKQLQRYQNTLNMAQIEKKNAIRKQMLAKAFKLKLMEVENQCNIELLRIKQNLQCLEPLQIIAEKWKANSNENSHDFTNFALIPRYPEFGANSGSGIKNMSTEKSETEIIVSNLNAEKYE